MQYIKDKQLINFRQKAINGFDVQNCPQAGQERLAGRMWPSGCTLPRSALIERETLIQKPVWALLLGDKNQ